MNQPTRRRSPITVSCAAITLILAACGPAASSATPSTPATPSFAPTSQPSATATATTSATANATPASTTSPAPTPAPSAACVVKAQTTELPSDRVTNLKVSSTATADRLTFVFGNPSLPGPPAPPEGTLEVAKPPYTAAGSGQTIDMTGQHVLQMRFSGMSLSNDAGQETYIGLPEIKPTMPALRHAVVYDASEGVIGWYVGYDGGGCVTLRADGNGVTVTIDHP